MHSSHTTKRDLIIYLELMKSWHNLICKKPALEINYDIHTRFYFILSYNKIALLTITKEDNFDELKEITGFCGHLFLTPFALSLFNKSFSSPSELLNVFIFFTSNSKTNNSMCNDWGSAHLNDYWTSINNLLPKPNQLFNSQKLIMYFSSQNLAQYFCLAYPNQVI